MTKLSKTEKQQFLSDLHVGVLSLTRTNKGPLSSPVWYSYTPGDGIRFITFKGNRKSELIEVGTRASFVVQDEAPPYSYVAVEGPVTSVEECTLDEIRSMAARYLGEDEADEYIKGANPETISVVEIQPEEWLAADFSRRG